MVDFDLLGYTKEEIINKVATGDLDLEEAESLLAERELQIKERSDHPPPWL